MGSNMARRKRRKYLNKFLVIIFLSLCFYLGYYFKDAFLETSSSHEIKSYESLENIPEYSGEAYIYLNSNVPEFSDDEKNIESFEYYSNLDSLGRCGVAFANVSVDTMPTDERESIGSVKPSGWHTVKYDIVSGKYLYNRCHLIGYQLTGENANEKNLITCTRYMNATTMLEFETEVANYIEETKNHVLYRVTPYFEGDNLVATGVQMEAYSVEDDGQLQFNVFVYNVQPGVVIDYLSGDSHLE